MSSESFHAMTIEETFKRLGTSSHGLSREEVDRRQWEFGKNILKEEKRSKLRIFIQQFNSVLIYVLLAASIVSLSIGEIKDFSMIICIILINGLIGFWQELKAETSIAALKKMTESRNEVVRDGSITWVGSSELVPGDYLIFHDGEVVTADVRLVESSGLMTDESAITGESMPIAKDHVEILPKDTPPYELKNMLLTGSTIVRGFGRGIVVQTAKNTYFAQIAEKSKEASPETPLTKALRFFTKRYVVLFFCFFLVLLVIGLFQGRSILELGYVLLASLVSAVPEGLPLVITLVMVIGALSLSKQKALVRYLPSVETLGSATVIASDKTGTITEGKLIVKEVFSKDPEKLIHIAALCNDSHNGSGDPLDVALADWVENLEEIRNKFPRKWAYSFDTRLMLMATVNAIDGGEELLVKGAYESLREKVENKAELEEIEAVFHTFLDKGLRVLAFGVGKWEHQDPSNWKIKIIGLIGFLDPPKIGVKEAVDTAQKAGIRVVMITGDHPKTAMAVAREVNIYLEGDRVLTGKEIEGLADDHLLEKLKQTTIFARILPEHKYRIVKLLQQNKEIVAVTGDGVNDVPALKSADIGIAMGGGTEAAKSVSKMVITDNNLKVIVEAIKNARVIADNIRKVIYYLISTSLQELFLLALAILSFLPVPLSAIQILWINIVTDGVQDKTFAFAKEEGNVMLRGPRRPEKQFFDRIQILRILIFGMTIGVLCYFLFVYFLQRFPFKVASTLIFTCVAAAQWANGVQAQKETEPFFKNVLRSLTINPLIFLGLAGGVVLQCIAIYLAPELFHSVPISLNQWKYPFFVFCIAFVLVEIRKWIELWFRSRYAGKISKS